MRKIAIYVMAMAITLGFLSTSVALSFAEIKPSSEIIGDLIIDGVQIEYANELVNVKGNVIVKNGGSLVLKNSELYIVSSYDEEHMIKLIGSSYLEAKKSLIRGKHYQISIIGEPEQDRSPYLYFEDTVVTRHLGIRPFGKTVVKAKNSIIEEIQLHDQAEVTINGGEELYPVFFFKNQIGELTNLKTDESITRKISILDGWTFNLNKAIIDGYQVDVEGASSVTLKNCTGITASIHTSGKLGDKEVIIENVTTGEKAESGIYDLLGPEIIYKDTIIELFNIYVADGDNVKILGGLVNEANTEGSSKLTISKCTIEYNLVQSYDKSLINIENCKIHYDDSYSPSVTAQGESQINIESSDCEKLEINAIEKGKINIYRAKNLNLENINVQDEGIVFVDSSSMSQQLIDTLR